MLLVWWCRCGGVSVVVYVWWCRGGCVQCTCISSVCGAD